MNCSAVCNALSAYIDRELPGQQMLSIRDHLNACPQCHQEWKELSSLKSQLERMPMVEPPTDFEERILRIVRTGDDIPKPKPATAGLLIATSIAAAVLAVVVFQGASRPVPNDQIVEAPFDVENDRFGLEGEAFGHPAPALPAGMTGIE